VGGGTPGPWDAPSRVVAAGPYRWVRNPIYLAALLVVLGEAWLFLSLPLLAYAGAMAVLFHLFVTGYEEPTLRRHFGRTYLEYQRMVPRWIPPPAAPRLGAPLHPSHCSRASLAATVTSVELTVRSIAANSSGGAGRPRRKP
jgi:hypothetical protein